MGQNKVFVYVRPGKVLFKFSKSKTEHLFNITRHAETAVADFKPTLFKVEAKHSDALER